MTIRTAQRVATFVALLGAAALLAARPAEAADARGSLQVGARLGPRLVVQADRRALTLAPGESATVMVTVKVRVARGERVPVALEAPWDGPEVRYAFQGQAGRLAGPTTLGAVAASGVHRIPLTLTLDGAAPGPVRLPLALRGGGGTVTLAAATLTRVSP